MAKKSLREKVPFAIKWRIAKIGLKFLRRIAAFSDRFITSPPKINNWRTAIREKTLRQKSANNEKLKILVFFDRVPMPDKDSSSVRMLAILRILAGFADVYFVPVYYQAEHQSYEHLLEEIGVEIVSVLDFEVQLKNFDIAFAILAYPMVAKNMLPAVKRSFPAAKIIFDTVDVHFVRLEREAQLKNDAEIARQAAKLKKIEIKAAQNSAQIWCVTEADRKFLNAVVPAVQIEIVPNIHDLHERGKSFAARRDLLFIGGFAHRPNADAVFYFVKEILPRLLEAKPDIRLHIVGSETPPEIFALGSKNVLVHGFVADVAPLFAGCRVFIAPLRYGGGMKGKIGQAMAYGLPVITTPIGAEGMNLTDGREVVIAAEPLPFVKAILRVYDNEELWQALAANGYSFIAENFSPAAVEKNIRAALRRILPDIKF